MPEEMEIEGKNEWLAITQIFWSVAFSSSISSTYTATVSQISNNCMTLLGLSWGWFVFSAARFSYDFLPKIINLPIPTTDVSFQSPLFLILWHFPFRPKGNCQEET